MNIDMNSATVAQGINVLAILFDEDKRQYSAMNTARSGMNHLHHQDKSTPVSLQGQERIEC